MSETLPVIYLARRGETAWNLTGQHMGVRDMPMTERGESNARRFGSPSRPRLNLGLHSREGLTRRGRGRCSVKPGNKATTSTTARSPGPFPAGITGRKSSPGSLSTRVGRRERRFNFLGTPVALPFHARITIVSRTWRGVRRRLAPTKPREQGNGRRDGTQTETKSGTAALRRRFRGAVRRPGFRTGRKSTAHFSGVIQRDCQV